MNILNVVGMTILGVVLMVFVSFLLSYPFMLLWNGCLVPAVSTLSQLSWLQAWGVMIACGFMFKSSVSA